MMKLFLRPTVLALFGGLSVTSLVYAQDARPAPQPPAQPEHGMMMNGDMSAMMARMNKMMDSCEKMMQSNEKPKGRAQ
jgi:hypothetical protein